MKSCSRQVPLFLLLLGALLTALITFLLVYTGRLVLTPGGVRTTVVFSLTALLPGLGLPVLTAGLVRFGRSSALGCAWAPCGLLSTAGAAGAVLLSLFALVSTALNLGVQLAAALLAGCLFLYLAGLVCFLHQYLAARACHFAAGSCGC